jgi:uncharacterized Tic20 family protein
MSQTPDDPYQQYPSGEQNTAGEPFPGGMQYPSGEQYPVGGPYAAYSGGEQYPGAQQSPGGQQYPGAQQYSNAEQYPGGQQYSGYPSAEQYPGGQQYSGYPSAQGPQYEMAQYVGITADERNMAALAHGLAIVFGFLGPLLIMLIKGEQSQFVKDQSKEALNFSITIAIAAFVSFLLCFVLIGFVLLPMVGIGAFVLHIVAAVAASRGEWYRYPLTLRLL